MMSRKEIVSALESIPHLEIFELTDAYVVVYDENFATDFTIRFAETFTKEDLKGLIHFSPSLPPALRPDVGALTDYLWEVMDHNAYLTLSGLWYVHSDEDYREMARFHSCEEGRFLPEFDAQGCMWCDRQVCIVDVGRICSQNPGCAVDYLRREVMVTTLHELRHLMLDTNPVLPLDEYPLEWGTETRVEEFAQDICQAERILLLFSEQ